MAQDVGKVFEQELEAVFKQLKDSHLLGWHRFPDTHSAGGEQIIQPQPSDYLLGLPYGSRLPLGEPAGQQRMVLFEAKASEKHSSMRKSAVRPEQRGFIHFYAGMLNLPYLLCHYSTVSGTLQLWDGRAVMKDRLSVADDLLFEFSAGDGRKLHKDKVAEELAGFFCLPDKLKTVRLYQQTD